MLFVCNQNDIRSIIAEAILNEHAGDRYIADSAGIEPGTIHPLAIQSLKDIGIDISGKQTKSIFDLHKKDESYDYIITVCNEFTYVKCLEFSGNTKVLHWHFDEPKGFYLEPGKRMHYMVDFRNEVLDKIEALDKKIKNEKL